MHEFELVPDPTMIVRPVGDPPAAVVDLATAKAHLRVTQSAEDALITTYIAAAQAAVLAYTETSLIAQTWEALVGGVGGSTEPIVLPWGPVTAVTAVESVAVDGTRTPLVGWVASGPVVLPPAEGWPAAPAAVAITYAAGPETPEDPVVLALLLLLAQYYDHRAAILTGTISTTLPFAVEWLLAPYRRSSGLVPL